MSEVSRDVLIILIVIALLVGLAIILAVTVYICYFRRRKAASSKRRHQRGDREGPGRSRPLPSAADMKRTDRGEIIAADPDTGAGDIAIMGAPSSANDGAEKGGPTVNRNYLRDANDPADVAYAYMKGDVPHRKPRDKQEPNYEVNGHKKKQSSDPRDGTPAHKRSHWDDPPDNAVPAHLFKTEGIYQNSKHVSKSRKT